ncbi:MAG: LacI family DNA-binding transcriptional regulator [Bacteroidota bacterium]|jgi:LacI family transcriptional regulator
MQSSIIDVAKKAGVSIATVSRVINGSDKVKAPTKEKVLEVVRDLKYVPNPAARGLIMKRTEAIGLLLPDLHGEFFSEIIRGADEAVQLKGYHLIVSSSHNDIKEIEAALRFMRGRVDALVVMSPMVHSEVLLENLPKSLPVVLLNCHTSNPMYDTIMTDGFTGAKEMVTYLLDQGHRKIAILKGGDSNIESQERLKGCRSALSEKGIAFDPAMEFSGNFTETSGYEQAKKIIALQDRPSAIFAFNDSMAIGAIGAIRDAGLKIPDDISICGFDDIPIAKFLNPSLTSVRVPIHELGAMAIHRIFDRIEKKTKEASAHIYVQTALSIRESCKPIHQSVQSTKEGNVA